MHGERADPSGGRRPCQVFARGFEFQLVGGAFGFRLLVAPRRRDDMKSRPNSEGLM